MVICPSVLLERKKSSPKAVGWAGSSPLQATPGVGMGRGIHGFCSVSQGGWVGLLEWGTGIAHGHITSVPVHQGSWGTEDENINLMQNPETSVITCSSLQLLSLL